MGTQRSSLDPTASGVGKGVAEEVIYFLAIGECSAPKAPGGEAQENQSAHCAWGRKKGPGQRGRCVCWLWFKKELFGGNLHSEFMNREDRLRARTLAKG